MIRQYDALADMMEEVHECVNALMNGRYIALEAAETLEEASRSINHMLGYDPMCRSYSGFLKQLARDTQLLPDNALVPRLMRPRRRWGW